MSATDPGFVKLMDTKGIDVKYHQCLYALCGGDIEYLNYITVDDLNSLPGPVARGLVAKLRPTEVPPRSSFRQTDEIMTTEEFTELREWVKGQREKQRQEGLGEEARARDQAQQELVEKNYKFVAAVNRQLVTRRQELEGKRGAFFAFPSGEYLAREDHDATDPSKRYIDLVSQPGFLMMALSIADGWPYFEVPAMVTRHGTHQDAIADYPTMRVYIDTMMARGLLCVMNEDVFQSKDALQQTRTGADTTPAAAPSLLGALLSPIVSGGDTPAAETETAHINGRLLSTQRFTVVLDKVPFTGHCVSSVEYGVGAAVDCAANLDSAIPAIVIGWRALSMKNHNLTLHSGAVHLLHH